MPIVSEVSACRLASGQDSSGGAVAGAMQKHVSGGVVAGAMQEHVLPRFDLLAAAASRLRRVAMRLGGFEVGRGGAEPCEQGARALQEHKVCLAKRIPSASMGESSATANAE